MPSVLVLSPCPQSFAEHAEDAEDSRPEDAEDAEDSYDLRRRFLNRRPPAPTTLFLRRPSPPPLPHPLAPHALGSNGSSWGVWELEALDHKRGTHHKSQIVITRHMCITLTTRPPLMKEAFSLEVIHESGSVSQHVAIVAPGQEVAF